MKLQYLAIYPQNTEIDNIFDELNVKDNTIKFVVLMKYAKKNLTIFKCKLDKIENVYKTFEKSPSVTKLPIQLNQTDINLIKEICRIVNNYFNEYTINIEDMYSIFIGFAMLNGASKSEIKTIYDLVLKSSYGKHN